MADTKISNMTAASALDGTELVAGVQSGANVKITADQQKTWSSASPNLVTPTLGVATATSINKVAITAPATSATLTIVNGKTLTVSNIITLAGTDSTVMTFPTTSATIARTDAAQTYGVAAGQTLAAGTTAVAPLNYQSGTNLTSAAAGASEFDGVQFYNTIDTSSGRGAVPVEQYFHLAANGSTISTIANFFGANSNISLVASAYYIIDVYLWYTVATQGTVTWTLTNSAAPTSQNIYYEMSPAGTGVVAPPGTATMLVGQANNDASAALAYTTGTINDATTNYAHFKIWLKNGTGTSLKIQATKNVGGTITPQLNSYWIARRMAPGNVGTFAA